MTEIHLCSWEVGGGGGGGDAERNWFYYPSGTAYTAIYLHQSFEQTLLDKTTPHPIEDITG